MADTLQTQVERDILPWILSIKRVASWPVQPLLRLYRIFDFLAQVALVLGGIGVSFPALNALGAIAGKETPPPQHPAQTDKKDGDSPSNTPSPAESDWVKELRKFASGQHPGVAVVLLLGWGGATAFFRKYKMAERSVLVEALQEEGRKLEKELLDALTKRKAAPGLLQAIQERVNNLIDTHIGPRSYPLPTPLEGTDVEARHTVAVWVAKYTDVPWNAPLPD